MNWIYLTDINQIDDIDRLSHEAPQWIFKHSTRCIGSKIALRRIENNIELRNKPGFFLDLIKFRNLSNKIETHYNIRHQSPQILIIKNADCIYSESHMAINPEELMEFL